MNFRKQSAVATAVALVAATVLASVQASAQDRVRWKMQSAFGSQLPHLGTSGVRFADNVERVSDRTLQIEFFEPGAVRGHSTH